MYETILLPTDGSDESLRALDHAIDLAETYDAVLHALYVVDIGYRYGDMDGATIDWEPITAALRREGDRTIETVEQRADRNGVAFVGAIREARAIHRAILEYAAENEADVIVMGTHGRRGVDRWLLGSVTERIVRTADVPVLTVRGEAKTEE